MRDLRTYNLNHMEWNVGSAENLQLPGIPMAARSLEVHLFFAHVLIQIQKTKDMWKIKNKIFPVLPKTCHTNIFLFHSLFFD